MLSKVARRFGYKLECTGRPGKRGEQVRIYEVQSAYPESHQGEIFDALDRKWRADLESVSTVSSNIKIYIETVDTEPETMPPEESPPPLVQGQQVEFCLDKSVCIVQRVESGGAILKRIDNPFQTTTFFARFADLRAV
jgi:hypothetical protein